MSFFNAKNNKQYVLLNFLETEKMNAIMNWAKKYCLLFMSDAGYENINFHKSLWLEYGFTTLEHITCGAHGLHNVAKVLPKVLPNANKLIVKVPEIFARASTRRNRWRELNSKTKIKLPPQQCDTRFLSWLQCCVYYAIPENRTAVVTVMEDFLKTGDQTLKAKADEVLNLIKNPDVINEIEEAVKNYGNFIDAKEFFERKTSTLVDMVRIITSLENDLLANPNAHEMVKQKFSDVFTKNSG